nr:MAG TPA: hypothetical protein [Bacteriophage sp.]
MLIQEHSSQMGNRHIIIKLQTPIPMRLLPD